jgi:hypothetical protein
MLKGKNLRKIGLKKVLRGTGTIIRSPRKKEVASSSKESAPGHPQAPNSASTAPGWSVVRVRDQRTNLISFVISGPTRAGVSFTFTAPASQREELGRVRKALLDFEAALPGNKSNDIKFLAKLIDGANATPLIATDKPGFTDSGNGFVLGLQLLGDARTRYHWLGDTGDMALGACAGTKEGWEEVAKLLEHSTFATLALLSVLASVAVKYVEKRKSDNPAWRPLVSETATFNLVCQSAGGKTIACGAAASASGNPLNRSKWDFTRRGLEEVLHSRNEVGVIFDDVEKHTGEHLPLRKALVMVTQYVSDGASKAISTVVAEKGLPRLTWSEFGLSSSPLPIDQIGREQKWTRSLGEKVRFCDLIVPPAAEGGIIDCPPPGVGPAEFSAATVDEIERGFLRHFGHLLPAWINLLLSEDYSSTLIERQDIFVRERAAGDSGWDVRHARKFGALYAVGYLAVDKGLLPWSRTWPQIAASSCYNSAVRAAQGDDGLLKKALERLVAVAFDPRRIVDVRNRKSATTPAITKLHAGIIATHKNEKVFGILERSLIEIAGDKQSKEALIAELTTTGAYVGGHGHAGTSQIAIPMIIDGKKVQKPRFWLLDYGSLLFIHEHDTWVRANTV